MRSISSLKLNLTLKVKVNPPPKTIWILTKVFYTFGSNLAILAWTSVKLSHGQAYDWRPHGQTQATTIPEGQNWPRVIKASWKTGSWISFGDKQGKSEGFESCDRPIVRKRPIWVKIGDVLSRVTLKFDGWPLKTIGHLSFAVSSFVQHFIAIGEFKLELQSGNAQFGSNSTIFRAVRPWNLTDDLEKQ